MKKGLSVVSVLGLTFVPLSGTLMAYQEYDGYEEDLGRIVLTATRIAQHDYKIAGNVTVIDKMDIMLSNAETVPDVLKESLSPDSYKEKYLCVLRGSSAAGGEI